MGGLSAIVGTWARLVGFQVVGLTLSVLTIGIAAVAISPGAWGDYGLLLSVVQVGQAFGLSWISQSLMRVGREEFVRDGRITQTLSASILLTLLSLAAVVAVLLLLGPGALDRLPSAAGPIWLIALALAAFAAFELASYAAQATGRLDGYTFGQLVAKLGPFVAVLAAWLGWVVAPVHLLAAAALGWTGAMLVTGRALVGERPRPAMISQEAIHSLMRYGRLLPIAGAAAILVTWIDVWIIRRQLGVDAAGIYWWAFNLLAIGSAVLIPLTAVLTPRGIDLRLKDSLIEIDDRRRVILSISVVTLIAVVAIAPVVAAAGAALLPSRYAAAAPIVAILAISLPAQLLAYAGAPLAQAFEDRMPRIVLLHVIAAAMKTAATYGLVMSLGAIGGAVSTGIAIWFLALSLIELIPKPDLASDLVRRDTRLVAAGAAVGLLVTLGAVGLPPPLGLALGAAAALILLVAARRLGLLAALLHLELLLAPLAPRWRDLAAAVLRLVAGPRIG